MNILEKIQNFNWMHFNDLGKELSTLVGSVQAIANDARKLGKDATAEQIAGLIVRVKALKDGSSLNELLSKILGQAESVFDEHAEERAKLLEIGQKSSADLDAPQDRPPDPKPRVFAYGEVLSADPDDSLLVNGDEIFKTVIDNRGFFMAWGRVGAKPNLNFPPPGGWELHRRVTK